MLVGEEGEEEGEEEEEEEKEEEKEGGGGGRRKRGKRRCYGVLGCYYGVGRNSLVSQGSTLLLRKLNPQKPR